MRDKHAEMLVYQALLNEAVARAAEPKPADPTPLPRPGDDASEDDIAIWEWLDAEQAAERETAVAEWEARAQANNTEMAALASKVREATEEYNRAFFGAAHDDVMAFFADQPQTLWDMFIEDIGTYFLPHPPTADDDEADGEGKSLTSST
jgi:hypothetical protein